MKHKHIKYFFTLTLLSFLLCGTDSRPVPYGADAVKPVTVRSLTNPVGIAAIFDEDNNTFWESAALLPHGWVGVPSANLWLDGQRFLVENQNKYAAAFDGNADTAADIKDDEFLLNIPKNATAIGFKFGSKATVILEILQNGKVTQTQTFQAADSYKFHTLTLPAGNNLQVKINSVNSFQIFEIACRPAELRERVLLDFDRVSPLQYLQLSDNRATDAVQNLRIYVQKNKYEKEEVVYENIREDLIKFDAEKQAAFVILEYTLAEKDWQKVRINEVTAYDRSGLYGKRKTAQKSKMPLKDLLGVNGYWSFGYDRYSKFIPPGEGPDLYAPLVSHFRTYHDMTWDVKDPDDPIDFTKMKISGTPAMEWLDWDKEYADWQATGVKIQASLQFFRFAPEAWSRAEQSAYNYAYAYARHFGPTQGNGLISTIEVGNEPWKYDAATYRKIITGMVRGAKDGDPAIEVFPCALQAAEPKFEQTAEFKNYVDARIPREIYPLLDGMNIHYYSYDNHNVYKQKTLPPESSASTWREITAAINWRDRHLPGKKIYLSEWGFESAGGGEDCTHRQCIPEAEAAAFAVRGALQAHRLGLDRATWYYYANETGKSRLYARAGLTASADAGFQKKQTYYAFAAMVEELGDLHFVKVYRESDAVWGYYYGDKNGKISHLILWRPTRLNAPTVTVDLGQHFNFKNAKRFVFEAEKTSETVELIRMEKGYRVEVGAVPVVLEVERF